MGFKLVRLDVQESAKIPLNIGVYTVGRGSFLGCHDHRVSRKHASLEVTDDTIILKSLHQNPCFYNKTNIKTTKVLLEGKSVPLSNGDHFGLLPDKNWYELILCTEDTPQDSTFRENCESEKVIDKNGDTTETESVNSDTESYTMGDGNEDLSKLKLQFDESMEEAGNESHSLLTGDGPVEDPVDPKKTTSPDNPSTPPPNEDQTSPDRTYCDRQTTPKRPHTPDPNNIAKKIKTEPESPTVANNAQDPKSIDPSPDQDPPIPMDTNSDSANDTDATDAEIDSQISVNDVKNEPPSPVDVKDVKKEPDSPKCDRKPDLAQPGSSNNQPGSSTDSAPKPPNKPPRERCIYAANCYRKNPQHKLDFSHPGDSDYGTGARGLCPYGAHCRRADPRHWAAHDHPPGTQPPAPRGLPHDRRQGNPAKKPRRRVVRQSSESENSDAHSPSPDLILHGKRKRKAMKRESWTDSDENETQDPYGTDESDEWVPPSNCLD